MVHQLRPALERFRPIVAPASPVVLIGVALGVLMVLGSQSPVSEMGSHVTLLASATLGILVASRLGGMLDARLQLQGRGVGRVLLEVYVLAWIVGEVVYLAGSVLFRSPGAELGDWHPGWMARSGLLLVVLFAVVNVVGHYVERVRDQEIALAALVDALDASRRLMIRSSDEMNREFAERLHGGVQARLLCAEAGLRRIDVAELPAEQGRRLVEVADMLESLRENEVRQLSHLMHPLVIRVGLVAALEELAVDMARRGAVQVDVVAPTAVRVLDRVDESGIAEPARLALYRATEEAIGNALRHGDARYVSVVLTLPRPGEVRVEVHDDGRGCVGFIPGFGILHATLRLEAHGGMCALREGKDGGSTFEASVRLRAEDVGAVARERSPASVGRRMRDRLSSGQSVMKVPSMNRRVAATRG